VTPDTEQFVEHLKTHGLYYGTADNESRSFHVCDSVKGEDSTVTTWIETCRTGDQEDILVTFYVHTVFHVDGTRLDVPSTIKKYMSNMDAGTFIDRMRRHFDAKKNIINAGQIANVASIKLNKQTAVQFANTILKSIRELEDLKK
jgi:hypothetical protein